jgi:hypothetical protein
MGHLPTDVAPDVRSRSYLIEAGLVIDEACEGVLVAHGDATSGYSLYLQAGHLVDDMNIGGEHVILRSTPPVSRGKQRLGVRVRRQSRVAIAGTGPVLSQFTLLIDGAPVGCIESQHGFFNFTSWTGLDIGRDRGAGFALLGPLRIHGHAHQGDCDNG